MFDNDDLDSVHDYRWGECVSGPWSEFYDKDEDESNENYDITSQPQISSSEMTKTVAPEVFSTNSEQHHPGCHNGQAFWCSACILLLAAIGWGCFTFRRWSR